MRRVTGDRKPKGSNIRAKLDKRSRFVQPESKAFTLNRKVSNGASYSNPKTLRVGEDSLLTNSRGLIARSDVRIPSNTAGLLLDYFFNSKPPVFNNAMSSSRKAKVVWIEQQETTISSTSRDASVQQNFRKDVGTQKEVYRSPAGKLVIGQVTMAILKGNRRIRDYFDYNRSFMKALLLEPPGSSKFDAIYTFSAIVHFSLVCMSVVLETLALYFSPYDDFSSAMLNIGILSLHLVSVNRVLGWFIVRKKFHAIVDVVKRSSFLENWDDLRRFKTEKMAAAKIRSLLLSGCYGLYVFLNITLSYYFNYHERTYEKFNPALNKTSVYRKYVYPLWYPFDTSLSDGYYMVGFLYQPYAFYSLVASFCCIDCHVLNTILHLKCQVEVVGRAFNMVDGAVGDDRNSQCRIKEIRVVQCIQELQMIYRAARRIEDLQSTQFLIQNGLAVFIMCANSFRVTSSMIKVDLEAESIFLSTMIFVVMAEVFNTCWYCYGFTLELLNLPARIYEMDWLSYPVPLRKKLLFCSARLQFPFYFTLGKWTFVTMGMYITILKMSYSFYTVIWRTAPE
ncbi:odorant receptor Or2-like [Cylas formicarius]|uniref:odorant receptor Or2-like n=1 Tax=Cylas formicarius TaxID=197179 RepID=UPI00295890C3|nr:odorant receptor Or2-like [Cylas formicarius]